MERRDWEWEVVKTCSQSNRINIGEKKKHYNVKNLTILHSVFWPKPVWAFTIIWHPSLCNLVEIRIPKKFLSILDRKSLRNPNLNEINPCVQHGKLSHLNLWNRSTKLNQAWQGWSLSGSLSKLCQWVV